MNRRPPSKSSRMARALLLPVAILAAAACMAVAVAVFALQLGVRPVLTGSMRPDYGPGSIVITKSVPVRSLHPGMIVVFVPPGEHVAFAHRITSVSGNPTAPIITTKGDANKAPDPWHAQLTTATVPEVVASVPFLGRLLVGLHGPLQLLLLVVGGLMVAVSGTHSILRPRSRLRAAG